VRKENELALARAEMRMVRWIITIIIKNECHSDIIIDRLQGCGMCGGTSDRQVKMVRACFEKR